jgi:hypothetical protein
VIVYFLRTAPAPAPTPRQNALHIRVLARPRFRAPKVLRAKG